MNKIISLKDLAKIINAECIGDSSLIITGISTVDFAKCDKICFLNDGKYLNKLNESEAKAVIVTNKYVDRISPHISKLIVEDAHIGFAQVAQFFDNTPRPEALIHKTAIIGNNVTLGDNVHIGPFVVIEDNVVIGNNAIIESHSSIGKNCKIGNNVWLHPHVVCYHNVELSDSVVIHSFSVIGSDGFGYAINKTTGQWLKVPQLGTARIGERTEIGSLTSIDRGSILDTVVDGNVIIDNHTHLAHNVKIGYGTAMPAGSIVGGSTNVGKYCIVGGASVVSSHLNIADKTTIIGMSLVVSPPKEPGQMIAGHPTQSFIDWKKSNFLNTYKSQKELRDKLDILEKKLK